MGMGYPIFEFFNPCNYSIWEKFKFLNFFYRFLISHFGYGLPHFHVPRIFKKHIAYCNIQSDKKIEVCRPTVPVGKMSWISNEYVSNVGLIFVLSELSSISNEYEANMWFKDLNKFWLKTVYKWILI